MKAPKAVVALLCLLTLANTARTQINFSPALTLNASCQATNDQEEASFWQMLACHCGPGYQVFANHYSTTPSAISSYTFEPGNTYTIQINASASGTGDLKSPLSVNASTIYFAISLGTAAYTNQLSSLSSIPSYSALNVAGALAFVPPFPATWQGTSDVDLTNTFLTNIIGYGSLPNNGVAQNSTVTASFMVGAPTTGFNIEAVPVPSDLNPPVTENESGGVGTVYNSQPPTNTTITINSITINQTAISYPAPLINGGSSFYFSSSQNSGGGTINGTPGQTIKVTVAANGPPPATYSAEFNIGGGVILSNGSSSASVSNGSTLVTFTMPSSGSVSWTGNFSESNSEGSGSISVSY